MMGKLAARLLKLTEGSLQFTDFIVEPDQAIMIKTPQGWQVHPSDTEVVGYDEIAEFLGEIDNDWEGTLRNGASINRPCTLKSCRLRVNGYNAGAGAKLMLAIRKMPNEPMSIAKIGLPHSANLFIQQTCGLLLVSGATGSGKSTTLAALIEQINQIRSAHIVTIEDPIEIIFVKNQAIFSQREIGTDVNSFYEGVRDAMRQRPDVIVIGEIRDRDTADTAILAAESGHLVIGTIHANTGAGTIQKLLSFFNSFERESRAQSLSQSLIGVISQLLLPMKTQEDKNHEEQGQKQGAGYALAAEIIFNHKQQISKFIDDPEKLQKWLENSDDGVSCSMLVSLSNLITTGKISKADAIRYAPGNKTALKDKLQNIQEGKS